MADIIAAVCPKCGADLELPKDVSRAYCTYCGRKIILTKTEVHHHTGTGSIDNYYELGKRAYDVGDFEGAIRHLEEGLELDPKHKEVNNLITQAYYGYAMQLLKQAEAKREQANDEIVYARRTSVHVGGIGDSDNRRVHRHLDDIDDRLDDVHWSKVEEYRGEALELENKAKIYFKKAGVCPDCFGKRWCRHCAGSGTCPSCKGSGTKYLIMTCSDCSGYRYCSYCRGWRYCPSCRGTCKYPPPKDKTPPRTTPPSSYQHNQYYQYPQYNQYYSHH
jgi:tetratricopeptide (TPR) repeat protein